MRLLLDTNIIISGLLSKNGPPGELLHAWLTQSRFELVTSEEQLEELTRALNYEHLRSRISPAQARNVLDNLDAHAIVARDLPILTVSPDPGDNAILATAVAGKADLIVSGDQAGMLDLKEVSAIAIVTPREAVERLRGTGI